MIKENIVCVLLFSASYLGICLALPAFCLYPVVRGKALSFRLLFYQAAANLYLILWGFILSFLKLFYAPVLWAAVALPVAVRLWLDRGKRQEKEGQIQDFFLDVRSGILGRRQIFRKGRGWLSKKLRQFYGMYLKGRLLELAAWVGFLAFIVSYFGWYKLHNTAYAFTDEETHLYWIQSLVHNNAFPAGMYPYGMHFLVGILTSMFGMSVTRAWLMFSIFSAVFIFWAAYLFLRTVFPSRAACVFAMGVFLLNDWFQVTTYYRYQMSLPMEFALMGLFASLAGICSYVEDSEKSSLWLFAMGLAWTFQAHFYVTIFSLFLWLAFGIVYLVRMLKKKLLHKVILAALLSMLLSALPFAVGYLCGYEFERSIAWALVTMQGGDASATLEGDMTDVDVWDKTTAEAEEEEEEEEDFTEQWNAVENVDDFWRLLCDMLQKNCFRSEEGVGICVAICMLVFLCGAIGCFWSLLRRKGAFVLPARFLFLSLAWLLSVFCHCMGYLGLPEVVHVIRAAIFLNIMTMPLYAALGQLACSLIGCLPLGKGKIDAVLTAASMAGLICWYQEGPVKSLSNLYYLITMQEADMRVCLDLVDHFEDFQWTVMSSTNNLSVIRYDGYHYEIIDLLEELESGETEITIPTPDIFIVVEKYVIDFFASNGVDEKRALDGSDYMEYAVEVDAQEASERLEDIQYNGYTLNTLPTADRVYYEFRVPVMSKFYYWMEKIKEVYPDETSVYYQDEKCTVYRIRQDPYFLLNLSVDYTDMLGTADESVSSEE